MWWDFGSYLNHREDLDIFVLAAGTKLCSDWKFWLAFCGLWLEYQLCFQALTVLFRSVPCVQLSSQSGLGTGLSFSSAFKVYTILLRVRFIHVLLRSEPGSSYSFTGLFSLTSPFPQFPLYFMASSGPPFRSLARKLELNLSFSTTHFPWLSLNPRPRGRKMEREK